MVFLKIYIKKIILGLWFLVKYWLKKIRGGDYVYIVLYKNVYKNLVILLFMV